MDTKVKICGIKLLKEVEFINEMDIDYVGLVFAKSIRQVNVETAKNLANAIRDDIKICGVFVDKSIDEINLIAKEVGLDIAQVHKNYTETMVNEIAIPVWYAISIKDKNSVLKANEVYNYKNVVGVVTDTYIKGQMGGTGKTFNWDLLDGIDSNVNLILAGGLNPSNILNAINAVKPDVVDISSGVEHVVNGKTMKSKEKVMELIRKAKGYE